MKLPKIPFSRQPPTHIGFEFVLNLISQGRMNHFGSDE